MSITVIKAGGNRSCCPPPLPQKCKRGKQGPQGNDGSQGPQGEDGARGPQGEDGARGPQGDEGRDGVQGPRGPCCGTQGKNGPQGAIGKGDTGVQGPRGIDGVQGPRGAEGPQGERGADGIQGKIGPQGNRGFQGEKGVQGFKGVQGRTGQNAAIESIFLWSVTTQTKGADATVFQYVVLENHIGPSIDWDPVDPLTNIEFTSHNGGWYLMTYKLDIRTQGGLTNTTRAAAALVLDGVQIQGSGSTAQAPEGNHMYSISNTVLVNYAPMQKLSLQWWARAYSGTTPQPGNITLGPNQDPFITGTLLPNNNPYTEAVASLVITRIVDSATLL